VEDCRSGGGGDCFDHDRLRRVVGDAAVTDGRANHVHAPSTRGASVSRDLRIAQPVAGRRTIAFVAIDTTGRLTAADTGPGALYIRSLGSEGARMLPGTEGAFSPFWSPDGQFIGFISGGNLKKVAVAGGPPVTLTEHAYGRSAWSAQGVILYSRLDVLGGLYRIPDNGGQPTLVTELDRSRDELTHAHPMFLPDGRRFLFLGQSNDRSKSAIYLASLDSRTRTHLLDVHSQPDYASWVLAVSAAAR
jgi:Tol biopolymer transport system component